jgi:hypothetical protein
MKPTGRQIINSAVSKADTLIPTQKTVRPSPNANEPPTATPYRDRVVIIDKTRATTAIANVVSVSPKQEEVTGCAKRKGDERNEQRALQKAQLLSNSNHPNHTNRHKHTSYRIPEHESGHALCRCHEKTLPTGKPERDGRRSNGEMKTKGGNNNSLNNQKTKGPNQGTHRVGGTAMARPNQGKTGGQTPSEESDTRKMDKAENTADSRAREVGHGGKVTMENSNEVLESL